MSWLILIYYWTVFHILSTSILHYFYFLNIFYWLCYYSCPILSPLYPPLPFSTLFLKANLTPWSSVWFEAEQNTCACGQEQEAVSSEPGDLSRGWDETAALGISELTLEGPHVKGTQCSQRGWYYLGIREVLISATSSLLPWYFITLSTPTPMNKEQRKGEWETMKWQSRLQPPGGIWGLKTEITVIYRK